MPRPTAHRRRACGPSTDLTPAGSRTPARSAGRRSAGPWSTRTARLDPRSSYAASKVAQEHYASAWARQAGGSAVALRYHNVYGPGMPRDTPYSGVAAMFRSAVERGEAPRVFEDGGQMRDFVHVEDVARANAARPRGRGRERQPGAATAYNVCSGRPVSIARGRAGRRGRRAGADGDRGVPARRRATHRRLARARAAADLGFSAEIGPDEGLARFATDPLRA